MSIFDACIPIDLRGPLWEWAFLGRQLLPIHARDQPLPLLRGERHHRVRRCRPDEMTLMQAPVTQPHASTIADMPDPLRQLRGLLLKREGGDRVMAKILAAVPKHGLESVLVAVELVLESGNPSVEHIENVLHRFKSTPPPANVETHLTVSEAPIADVGRYDSLRMEMNHPAQQTGTLLFHSRSGQSARTGAFASLRLWLRCFSEAKAMAEMMRFMAGLVWEIDLFYGHRWLTG